MISRSTTTAFFVRVLIGSALTQASHAQVAPGPEPVAAVKTDLLRSTPFDRIILTDDAVVEVDPISPRPLPPYDPKKDRSGGDDRRSKVGREAMIQIGKDDQAEQAKKIGRTSRAKPGDAAGAAPDEFNPNNWIAIHTREGLGQADIRDFKVRRALIKHIDYFEDLLLEEANRLKNAHRYAQAFECVLFLKARAPDWPGINEALDGLLFAEGSEALIGGDFDRGVRLLRELLARNKDYPGLVDQLVSAYSQRVERALELKFHARGRAVLHQLEAIAPNHSKYLAVKARFVELARQRLDAGKGLKGPARLDAAAEALRIWPELEEARPVYERAFAEVPTLDVAVRDVPSPLGPWVRTTADARTTRLLYHPLLDRDDSDSLKGKPPGQLAAAVETTDLGRRLVIRLRSGVIWSDGSRPVSAIDAARTLIDRSDPNSPRYRARWADLLERVETPDEGRVEVQFNRIPLRVGEWFTGPVGPAHAGDDGRISTTTRDRAWVTDGPFRCDASTPERLELLATAETSGTPSPRIKRIREVRIADGGKAVTALVRGEVSLLEHVPAARVTELRSQSGIAIGTYRQPVLHQIAFDGRNPALRNRSLKRGLSYAIDRKGLLEGRVLKRPADERNLVSDGPLPKGSYADAPDVKPFEYDPILAQMLLAAARKELGNAPITLKFEYPDLPEARLVAPVIAEAFRVVGEKSGLKVEVVERRESELEIELKRGRRFDLAYRVITCPDAISDLGPAIFPALDAPAEADPLGSAASLPVLQLMLELERSSEFPTAKGIATQIDREARSELPILPLWQLEDCYAWRSRLKGVPPTTGRLYQGVEGWVIEPWFARDPWTAGKE